MASRGNRVIRSVFCCWRVRVLIATNTSLGCDQSTRSRWLFGF
jgi:hypothetical protein